MSKIKSQTLNQLAIDSDWSLFLDRDGVINHQLPGDYVKSVSEFFILPGVLESMKDFAQHFGRIVIVTNQQGIGKGLMTHEQLAIVHQQMMKQVEESEGRIDQIYYCPELAGDNPKCRKPNTGMAEQAKSDFPEIDFEKSIMVGDSLSDLQFGNQLGMHTVFVSKGRNPLPEGTAEAADTIVENLPAMRSHCNF